MNDRETLFRLAYGDTRDGNPMDARLLHFKMGVSPEEVAPFLRMIGPYNGFDPDAVISALEPLLGELMTVMVGRENSPVIYATAPYWTHQRMDGGGSNGHAFPPVSGERIPEDERGATVARFLAAMRNAGADEADDLGHALRVWWD